MTIAFNSTTESGFIKNDFDQIAAYLSGADDSTTLETRLDTLATTSDLDNVHDNLTIDRNGANKLQIKDLSITNDKISNQTIEDTKLNFGTLVKLYDWTATTGTTQQNFDITDVYSGRCIISFVNGASGSTQYDTSLRFNNLSANSYRQSICGVTDAGAAHLSSNFGTSISNICGSYGAGVKTFGIIDFIFNKEYFLANIESHYSTSSTAYYRTIKVFYQHTGIITPSTLNFLFPNNLGVGTNIKIYKYT